MSATVPDPVIVAHRLIAVLGALILAAATMMFGAPASQAAIPADTAAGSTISITDKLSSQHLSVAPGSTVTWVNEDDDSHRITSDKGASVEFDSGVLEPGDRFTHTFSSAGDVTYHDASHAKDASYFGMVMVQPDASRTSTTNLSATPALFTGGNTAAQPAAFTTAAASDLPTHVEVEIHNKNEFRPATVTIAKGGTVEWYNDHSDIHTATGAGGIDSGDLDRDERYSKTFKTPGTYDYVCIYHERMQATVKVADANGNVPPPANGGGGGTPPPPGNGGEQVAVSIGKSFSPAKVTVPAGSVVTWNNNDSAPHTATGTGFDTGMLTTGQKKGIPFNTPGTFNYVCDYHSNMTGTVTVVDGNGNAPPPQDPPPPPAPKDPPPPPPGDNPPPPGNNPPPGGGTDAPASAAVTVDDDLFSPRTVTIRTGGTVTWNNRGNTHTVTARDGSFDSGMMDTGRTFRHKFPNAGTYTYDCILHEGMTGTVKVTDASGAVPPPKKTPKPGPGKPGPGKPGPGGPSGPGGGNAPGGGGTPAPNAETHTITMGSSSFSPKVLNARVGDTVIWKNGSSVPHNVEPLTSDPIMGGGTYTTVLRDQGTLSYRCTFHPGMSGTIKVAAAPAGTKLPPPSADEGISGGSSAALPSTTSSGSSSSTGSSGGTPSPTAESHTINMVNSAFDPQVLQARVGDEVTWVNQDPIPHNVTGGPLDSGMMMGGASFTTVLTEAGTIEYDCTLHPGMTGTLEVAEALPGTEVPPASSSSTSSSSAPDSAPSSGDKSSTEKPDAGAQNHVVTMKDMVFSPDTLEVHVGDTVTFVNEDAAPHTATAEDKSWDSGNMELGDEWTLKLDKVGTVDYVCIYHPNMVGQLIVKAADEEIAPAGSGSGSDGAGADTSNMSASQIAGFSSGWLVLLAFLAGLQVQSRFSARRRPHNQV